MIGIITTVQVQIVESAAQRIRRGHPWIYQQALKPRQKIDHGAFVEVFFERERLGVGIFDADCPIAIRMYGGPDAPKLSIDRIASRIAEVATSHAAIFDLADTSAYRLCNGEGDRVPAFVFDRYGDVGVVRLDGSALGVHFAELLPRIGGIAKRLGLKTLLARKLESENKVVEVWGRSPDPIIEVTERGTKMEIDLFSGQKTGAFLDQRENRAHVRGFARGRVLNLFSYQGGFSVAAAIGGATEVTSVDIAPRAHAVAQKNFRLNGLDPKAHQFVTADAFKFIASLSSKREKFDIVISDPPSLAPNEKSKARALAAYATLHKHCASVLADGGVFCAASCSSHVSLEDFMSTLDDRALGRALSVRATYGLPADHPTIAAFPEGRYLKFVELV
jgi:23S rRNA (cytosine1962-C5)-methyltransferase